MTLKEQVLVAAENLLAATPNGLTGEALTGLVAKQIQRQIPLTQVASVLRERPQRFVEGEGGRWHLRQQEIVLLPDEPLVSQTPTTVASSHLLKRGCYVVFDLEATRQDAYSDATEIIQIAAQRFVDGVAQPAWASFASPLVPIPEHIIQLTKISNEDVCNAPPLANVMRDFFAYVGDLPLIAHNGASYDGPLLQTTCTRLGLALPATFRVLDTLPLARVLLPNAESHRVGSLAEYFGCARPDAHRADADVEMLAGIVQGLERELHTGASGAAVYELLRRAHDPWIELLTPPAHTAFLPEIIATFGANVTPLLPERLASTRGPVSASVVEATFARSEELGRTRRDAQLEMSQLAAETLRTGGYAIIEAGTGTGKSQGYLIPAALHARATGQPVAVATYTRVLQTQLIERELPFVQQLVPDMTYTQLQGRANYLSLSRLAEEVEDALSEETLPAPRAWMLAALVRFAATSTHGNLDELGLTPQSLEEFLAAEGSVLQTLASVRSSQDDRLAAAMPVNFYQRARENAERADLVVVNHALLLKGNIDNTTDEVAFAGAVICDEAHNIEDAATSALEQRVEERILRRILRAIYDGRSASGLVRDCRRRLGFASNDATLVATVKAVDDTHAALDSLVAQLHRYVAGQTVVARADLERYGVSVRIDAGALSAAGGPALKTTEVSLGQSLTALRAALTTLVETIGTQVPAAEEQATRRVAVPCDSRVHCYATCVFSSNTTPRSGHFATAVRMCVSSSWASSKRGQAPLAQRRLRACFRLP